jgi:hypothetical protein
LFAWAFGVDAVAISARCKFIASVLQAGMAHQLRENSDRIIDGKGVLRLEDAASERSTAA